MHSDQQQQRVACACIDCGEEALPAFLRVPKDSNVTAVAPPDAGHPGSSGFLINRCTDCGSVFLHPDYFGEARSIYSDPRYFTGFYPDNIHTGGGPQDSPPDAALRQVRYRGRAKELLAAAGLSAEAQPRVLEIGCGMGHVLQGMVGVGCRATGVEISDQALTCQERGLDVRHQDLLEADLPLGSFDLIYAIQVFEHVIDLGRLLDRVRELLSPTGKLVITVPNDLAGMRTKLFSDIWWMVPPMHVRYFSQDTLGTLFEPHGLSLCKLTTEGKVGNDLFNVWRWKLDQRGARRITRNPLWKAVRMATTHAALKPVDWLLARRGVHQSYLAAYEPAPDDA